jgi:hypothetical protein
MYVKADGVQMGRMKAPHGGFCGMTHLVCELNDSRSKCAFTHAKIETYTVTSRPDLE